MQGYSKLYVDKTRSNVERKRRFVYKKRGFGGLAPPKWPAPEHQPARHGGGCTHPSPRVNNKKKEKGANAFAP